MRKLRLGREWHWIRDRGNRRILLYLYREKNRGPAAKSYLVRARSARCLDQQINPISRRQTAERRFRLRGNRKRRIGQRRIVICWIELHAVLGGLHPFDSSWAVERHRCLVARVHNAPELHFVRVHLHARR